MRRGWGGTPAATAEDEDAPTDSDPVAGGDRSESGARFSSGQSDFPALGGSSRPGKPKPKPKLAGQWGRPKDAAKTTEQSSRRPAADGATCAAAQPVQDADASVLRVDETAAKVQEDEEDVADAPHGVENRQCGDSLQNNEASASTLGASPATPPQGLVWKRPCLEEAATTGPTDSREIESIASVADVDATSNIVVPEAPKFEHEQDVLRVENQKMEPDEPETLAEEGEAPAEAGEAPAEANPAPEAPQDGASGAATAEPSEPSTSILTEEFFPDLAASRPSAKRAPDATAWQKAPKSAPRRLDQAPSHLGKWAKPLMSKAQGGTPAPTTAAVSDASACEEQVEPSAATVGQPHLASEDLEVSQPKQQELPPEEVAPAVPVELDSAEAAGEEAESRQSVLDCRTAVIGEPLATECATSSNQMSEVLQPSAAVPVPTQTIVDEEAQPKIVTSPAAASPVAAEAPACQASSAATTANVASNGLTCASSVMSMPPTAAAESSNGDAIASSVQGAAPSQVAQPTTPSDAGAKSTATYSLQSASSKAGRRQAQVQMPQQETGGKKASSQTLPEAAPVKTDPRLGKWCKPLFASSGCDAAPASPSPPAREPSVSGEQTDIVAADGACGGAAPADTLPTDFLAEAPANVSHCETAPAPAAPPDEETTAEQGQAEVPPEMAAAAPEGRLEAPKELKAVEEAEKVLSPADAASTPARSAPQKAAALVSAQAAASCSPASPSVEAVKGGSKKAAAPSDEARKSKCGSEFGSSSQAHPAKKAGTVTSTSTATAARKSASAQQRAAVPVPDTTEKASSGTAPPSASSDIAAKKNSKAPQAEAPKSAASVAPAAKAEPKKPAVPPPSEVLTDAFGPALGAAPKKALASAWARLTKVADAVKPEPSEKEPEEASTAAPEDAGDAVPAVHTHEVDAKEATLAVPSEAQADLPVERTAKEGHDGENAEEKKPLEVEEPTNLPNEEEEEDAKDDVPKTCEKEEEPKEEEGKEGEPPEAAQETKELQTLDKGENKVVEHRDKVQDDEQRHQVEENHEEEDDGQEASANEEVEEEEEEKGKQESAAADANTQAAEAAAALKPRPAASEILARPDRGMEDIETADSSGTGLKGEVEQTDEEPSDEEASSAFGSIASVPQARDSDADGIRDVPLRPAQAGTPYSPARSCPSQAESSMSMDIAELLRWREASESTPTLDCIHCVAIGVETTELATASRMSVARTPSHIDRTPSSKTFSSRNSFRGNNLPQRTPKGGVRRGDRREREDHEPLQPLEVSSSSWVAQQRHWREERDQQPVDPSGNAGIGDTMITRRIRAILNKLTVEKFVRLLEQLTSCGISTKEHLEILIHEIMEKATTQHHFIPMYTQLCTVLNDWCTENQIGDGSKGSFKRILLNECQKSFERYLKPPQHLKDLKGEERDEAEVKYKTARVGNIRFVGELLAKNMVASTVIVAVTKELLVKPEVPELLESLAAFLTTVGSLFDRPDWKHREVLEKVFKDIRHLSRDSAVPARIRCLLSDVLDLRAAGWQDQKLATTSIEGPMTLEQVHTRAAESSSRQNGGGQLRSQRSWSDSGGWSTPAAPAGRYPRSNSYGGTDGWTTARATPKASLARVAETAATSQKAATSSASSARAGAVVKELTISHDITEALEAVKELRIPTERQPLEFAKMVAQAAEEASAKTRKICFSFVVQVFVTGLFEKSQLVPGMEKLCKRLEDLQSDVPALSEIIREEWNPALEELVQQGFLTTQRHEALVEATRKLFR